MFCGKGQFRNANEWRILFLDEAEDAMTGTVLILGASGRFGRNAAEAFWNAGWRVRVFDRSRDDLVEAARGVDVIVNAWNPPYTEWADALPRLTKQVISAAKASGATVLLPGNVYVFGADAPERLGPRVPHRASNPLGRLRIDMEAAYRASGVRMILLRAGDFLDTEASGNWFDMQIAPALHRGVLTCPGAPDAPHAWAYLPDMARAAVALCDMRTRLPQFADIPFPGHTLTGHQLAEACSVALNRPVRIRRMAWWPLQLARPFWPMAAPLLEMRYLWSKPHRLARDPFDALLPGFVETPIHEALGKAVAPVLMAAQRRPRRARAAPRLAPGR